MSITGTTASASAARLRSGTKSSAAGWDMSASWMGSQHRLRRRRLRVAILYTKVSGIQPSALRLRWQQFSSYHPTDHVDQRLPLLNLDSVYGTLEGELQLIRMLDALAVAARCRDDLFKVR